MRSPLPSLHAVQQGAKPLTQTLMDFGQDYRHAEAYAMLYLLATRHLITAAVHALNPVARIEFDSTRHDLLIIVSLGQYSLAQPLGCHAYHAALNLGLPSNSFLTWIEAQTGDLDHAILSLRDFPDEQRHAQHLAQQIVTQLETMLYQDNSLKA